MCLKSVERKVAATRANAGRARLSGDGFSSVEAFEGEMQRLFDNARTYNQPKSEVRWGTRDTIHLERLKRLRRLGRGLGIF